MSQRANNSGPSLSAIMVIPDKYETVRATMGHLKKQTAAAQIEIVFIGPSSCRAEINKDDLVPFHSWKFVPLEKIPSIASGFLAGVRQAGAPLVAFTEDHSYPDARWAELFIRDHQQPWAAVGPSMRNPNPDNLISQADYYQAYGQWDRPVSSGPVLTIPGHNSSYKREILESFGEDLDVLLQAESVLHRRLREQGYAIYLESGTCTAHLNFCTWANWIPARYYAGQQFAGAWAHSWSWIHRLAYAIASPGIPWLRLWRTRKYVTRQHGFFPASRILTIIFIGFVVEACGNLAGFVAGEGNAARKIAEYEFHRIRQNQS